MNRLTEMNSKSFVGLTRYALYIRIQYPIFHHTQHTYHAMPSPYLSHERIHCNNTHNSEAFFRTFFWKNEPKITWRKKTKIHCAQNVFKKKFQFKMEWNRINGFSKVLDALTCAFIYTMGASIETRRILGYQLQLL